MKGPPADDSVDWACHAWAAQWVANFANGDGGQVGGMTCTLGALSPARGPFAQHWPELYGREGLMIARALQLLRPGERLFLFRHYVERWYEHEPSGPRWRRRRRPLPQRCMAVEMGLTHGRYLRRRDRLKRRLQAWLWPTAKKTCATTSKSVLFGQVVEVSL